MTKHLNLKENCDFFSIDILNEIVVIRLKGHFLYSGADLTTKDKLLDFFDRIAKTESIKVVVIITSPEKTGRQELFDFYNHIFKSKLGINAIHRMFNVVDQLILKIVDLNKAIIHANSGDIILLFLNISLACDYRIVASNTVFQNPYLEMGLVPKGGGAYFLPKMLGCKKALEILLSGKDIAAKEALELGLVDKIAPHSQFEEIALEAARNFAQKPASFLFGIKKLLKYTVKDLREYLEIENQVLLRIVQSADFKSNFEKKLNRE